MVGSKPNGVVFPFEVSRHGDADHELALKVQVTSSSEDNICGVCF
jgi:hypothetical protein